MSGWGARLAVLMIFVIGFVSGGLAMHLYRLRIERQIIESPEPIITLTILGLDRDLHLTDDQKTQIRAILIEGRRKMLTAHPDLVPEIVDVFESTQGKVGDVLTPEQKPRYEQLVEDRRRLLREVQKNANTQIEKPPPPPG